MFEQLTEGLSGIGAAAGQAVQQGQQAAQQATQQGADPDRPELPERDHGPGTHTGVSILEQARSGGHTLTA